MYNVFCCCFKKNEKRNEYNSDFDELSWEQKLLKFENENNVYKNSVLNDQKKLGGHEGEKNNISMPYSK